VPLPPGFDDTEVAAAARRAGVIVTPGRAYYPAEPPGPHLRLTFAAASDVNSLDEGLRRLALALSDL
jgi:DNA-binding transcriptional MocR family regulator